MIGISASVSQPRSSTREMQSLEFANSFLPKTKKNSFPKTSEFIGERTKFFTIGLKLQLSFKEVSH